MSVVFGGIVPHPPIIIPEIGRGEIAKVKQTKEALERISKRVVGLKPDLVIFISPHGPVFQDGIVLNSERVLRGNFCNFGAKEVELTFENDLSYLNELERICKYKNISALQMNSKVASEYGVSMQLDHGALVPLYYLDKQCYSGQIVSVTMGLLSNSQLYNFGICLQETSKKLNKRIAVIASGDLSHCLKPESPAGFAPEGEVFDKRMVELLKDFNLLELISLEGELVEKAGECGLRPIIMMTGALDGHSVEQKVLSYEGPFGVGYIVAAFEVGSRDSQRRLLDEILRIKRQEMKEKRAKESPFVRLARESLETYLKEGVIGKYRGDLGKEFDDRKGVFVSIKKNGQLRGCIGTTSSTKPSVGEEIIHNAISAGTRDPRFFPVEEDELDELVYLVDILSDSEPIENLHQLDVEKYGVIVSSPRDGRSGLLLPNLEGIDSVKEQVSIAREKAGIAEGEPISLKRFEVLRYR